MNDNDITIWDCPKCKGKLIRRKNKEGQNFLGCTEFPRCRYTQKDETEQEQH